MVVVVACGLVACNGQKKQAPAAGNPGDAATVTAAAVVDAGPAKPGALRMRPKTQAELPTTAGDIYVGNMEGQLEASQRVLKYDPKSAPKVAAIAAMQYAVGKFRGDLDMIAAGIDTQGKAIALDPNNGQRYVVRASQEQTLHRFKQAHADLDEAKKLGAPAEDIAAQEQELDWNEGKYDTAIRSIHEAAARKKDLYTLAREAQLHHDLGEYDAAEREFEQAEDSFDTDTSPLPVAWLYVQRGIHLEKIGKPEIAVLFFREAVARIPKYVMASEHLAEALHMLGKDDEARAIYEDITHRSTDPEFMGALAGVYRKLGMTKEADALKAKATARYGELLVKYPEAMYWHASEYFLGEGGDPKKARDLLLKNVELRPNSTSWVALARAQLAAGDAPGAKTSIDKALAMPLVGAELFWTAARAYKAAGNAAKSTEYATRAKTLDPLIDKTEPAL